MKAGIHPAYNEINVICACGHTFKTRSTHKGDIRVEICSSCHPFFTGRQKLIDTAGRVDKFEKKYKATRGAKKAAEAGRLADEFRIKKGRMLDRSIRPFLCVLRTRYFLPSAFAGGACAARPAPSGTARRAAVWSGCRMARTASLWLSQIAWPSSLALLVQLRRTAAACGRRSTFSFATCSSSSLTLSRISLTRRLRTSSGSDSGRGAAGCRRC